jgi:hypothetical protein
MCSRLKAPSFSQGPGNFRDIAQNRRNDVTFPRMGSFRFRCSCRTFKRRYEPLTVEAVVYRYEDSGSRRRGCKNVTNDAKSAETSQCSERWCLPSRLLPWLSSSRLIAVTNEEFINAVLAGAQ